MTWWVMPLWLCPGMVSMELLQLGGGRQGQGGYDMICHLGYPAYLLPLSGTCKVPGVTVVLMPGLKLVKERAYAGFFFHDWRLVYTSGGVRSPAVATAFNTYRFFVVF